MEAITRGEDKSYPLEFTNADGSLMNLADKKIIVTVRLRDVVTAEKKNTAAGGSDAQIEVTAVGYATMKFDSADTINLEPCLLDGDVWVIDAAGKKTQMLGFKLPVQQAQTRVFP